MIPREEWKLSQKELVEILKPALPGVSTAAVSLAERSKVTGITFTQKAVKAAYAATGHVKKQEKRRNPYRVTLWITADMKRFLQAQAADGNINNFLRGMILQMMKEANANAAEN